jgi:hypothetical protein
MDWNTKQFIWLDWVVLAIGIILIVCVVYRAIQKDKKRMKGADSQDYLFGKGEPWYIIGAAIFAANIGSEHLVGLAGTGAKDGVGMAHWEMQGWMILILGWVFVPFYELLSKKLGRIITMPEFLKYRYTTKNRFLAEYHHIDCLYTYKGERNSIHRWYISLNICSDFLSGMERWDLLQLRRLHRLRRNEGCNDHVGYSNTYSYYWFVPGTLPWDLLLLETEALRQDGLT